MPPVLILLLRKLGPYAAVFAAALGLGMYVTHRFDLGAIDAARLALQTQVAADKDAVAKANAQVAADLVALHQAQDAALSAHMQAQAAAQRSAADERAQLAALAAKPGQDALTAPVLAAAMRDIAQAPGGMGK
ncbi:MAG: hypothetical protein ACLGP3_10435 [Acidobacteriota bacterium]